MQFNFNEDSNLYGYEDGNGDKDFEFPSNIKQMGCLDEEVKIYMEDYVYTYLYQYAKSNASKEKIAALVGKHIEANGQTMVIISGAIQGKDTIKENGTETFTKETWGYINHQMEIYFKGMSIVGWMHTQPGFGAFLMSRDEIFHREHFTHRWQVLYALDPLEKLDSFFVHNSENTGLRPAKGYYIYYSKNTNMQDYMMDNSLIKPKVSYDEMGRVEPAPYEEEEMSQTPIREVNERIDAAKKIRKVLNQKVEEEALTKQKYKILAGVSGVLCLACIMMGANLIHNQSRIAKLESEVTTVKTSYNTMAATISNTQAVFAAQNKVEELAKEEGVKQEEKAEKEIVQEPKNEAKTEPKEEPKEEKAKAKEEAVSPTAKSTRTIPETYIVEEGDTLGYISRKFYGSIGMVSQIMAANQMDNPDKIVVGKKIILP